MKTTLLFSMLYLLTYYASQAQLTGNKSIPGDYATVGAAISALNSSGVGAGGVTFNIAAGHTETITAGGYSITTTTSSAANPVVFQKSGVGVNPKISTAVAGSGSVSAATYGANGDAIIRIVGSDYITFDGIDLSEAYAGATGGAFTEYGFLLNKSTTDACNHIVIRNCVITMSRLRAFSIGIYQSNMNAAGTNQNVSAASGCAANNKFYGNTITAYHGIRCNGYNSSFPDTDVEIGVTAGNSFISFGGLSNSQNVFVIDCNYQENAKIAENTINGGSGTTNSASPWPTIFGVNFANGNDFPNTSIYNNNITIDVGSGEASITGISVSGGGYSLGPTHNTTVNIYNNTISSCRTNTIYQTFTGIIQSSAYDDVNIYNNRVINNTCGHIGALISNTNNSGTVGFAAQVDIYQNTITGNASTYNSSSPITSYLLRAQSVGTALLSVYENVVGENTSLMDYIYASWVTSGSTSPAEARFYKNTIRNISASGSTAYCYGLYVSSGILTEISNNFIADLKAPTASNANAITGIYITSSATNVSVLHNSISFAASTSGTNFGTYGIYTSTSPAVTLTNNIVSNNSTAKGTGRTVAYGRSSTSLASYGSSSDYNLFYAGTPSATNLIFYDGTNSDQTLAAYQTRVSSRDANSISTSPSAFFTSATDLHLGNCTGCAVENAGTTLATVSDDIDSEIRNSPPEIGADEISNPLPVSACCFEVSENNDQLYFSWTTYSETQNDHFTIEILNESGNWVPLLETYGAGNSNEKIHYQVEYPKINVDGMYFKLSQSDFDGVSNFIAYASLIDFQNSNQESIRLFPIPAIDIISIIGIRSETFEYYISDVSGRVMLKGLNEGLPIDISDLPSGCYSLTMKVGLQVYRKEFVIAK